MEKEIQKITAGVSARITSHKVALQFVLEELDATRRENHEAALFVRKSGFREIEYIGAIEKSFKEVDGPDGPQQFLINSIASLYTDTDMHMDKIIKMRCESPLDF